MPPAVLPAMMLGSGALSAGMQVAQGVQEKKAANAQAAAYEGQAGLVREAAGMTIARNDFETNRVVSEGIADAAARGTVPSSGSTAVTSRLNQSYGILQDMVAKYSGDIEAHKLMTAAANSRLQGRQALYGSLAGAGKSLLTSSLGTFLPSGMGGLGAKPSDLLKWSSSP
jgi:hypothetical protein